MISPFQSRRRSFTPANPGTMSSVQPVKSTGFTSSPFYSTFGSGQRQQTPQPAVTTPPDTQTPPQPQMSMEKPEVLAQRKLSSLIPTADTRQTQEPNMFQEQQKFLMDRQKQQQQYYADLANRRQQTLQSRLPEYDKAQEILQQNEAQDIGQTNAMQQQADAEAERVFREQQGQRAVSRREAEARTNNRFAALGTYDSAGAGSRQAAQQQVESDFQRGTDEGLNTKYQAILGNARSRDEAIRNIKTYTRTEKAKLEEAKRQIMENIDLNDVEKMNMLAQVEQETQANLLDAKSAWQQLQLSQSAASAKAGQLTEKQKAYQSASQGAEYALQLLNSGQVATGLGQGLLGSLGERTGANSNVQQDYRGTIGVVRTTLKNALLGANMSPAEMASLQPFIPEFSDAPNIARQKLTTFIREAQRLSGQPGEVQSETLNPQQLQAILSSLNTQ